MKKHQEGSRLFLYVLACFATMGGLLFGYDIGIISGSLLLIKQDFDLSSVWQEAIVSGTIANAAVFSMFAGYLNDLMGRKKVILLSSFFFVFSAAVMGAAVDKYMLLAGRLVSGVALGFASMTVPVYIAETAPTEIRGRLVTMNQLFINFGILISSLVAGGFSSDKETGWRYMLYLMGVPAVIQFIGFLFLPESPRWLLKKERVNDAERVLSKIRSTSDVTEEFNEMRELLDEERKRMAESDDLVLKKILITPHVRRILFVGCGLMFFQSLSGINTVIYYSGTVLQMAGFPVDQAIWLVCVPNAINMMSSFIGLFLVERLGRKILLVVSMFGVMVACVVLAVGFQIQAYNTPPINMTLQQENYKYGSGHDKCLNVKTCEPCITTKCGFCFVEGQETTTGTCLPYAEHIQVPDSSTVGYCMNSTTRQQHGVTWTTSYCPTDYAWIIIFGAGFFVFTFAPGMGPMPWTISSEIFPLWARGTGNSLSTGTVWLSNLFVSFTFITMTENITKYGTFYLFGGMSLLGAIFFIIFVPETKNKSLEQVETLFMSAEEKERSVQAKYALRLGVTNSAATAEEDDEKY